MGLTTTVCSEAMCSEAQELLKAWVDATRQFGDRVTALTKTNPGDFERMHQKCEHAWMLAENARLKFQLHKRRHGCLPYR